MTAELSTVGQMCLVQLNLGTAGQKQTFNSADKFFKNVFYFVVLKQKKHI